MIAPALLLLTVATVLVDCSPQRNGPSIFDQLSSLTTSRPDFQESQQLFSTQNRGMPASGTTGQLSEPSAASNRNSLPTPLPPKKKDYRIVYTIMSEKDCRCPFLPQYNPVCGTDGQTYANLGILNCNKECGVAVDVYLAGACPRSV